MTFCFLYNILAPKNLKEEPENHESSLHEFKYLSKRSEIFHRHDNNLYDIKYCNNDYTVL